MDISEARDVVLQVVDLRKRWGIQVGYEDFDKDKLLDALVALSEHETDTFQKDMLKVKQQLGAATSREKRNAKRKQDLEDKIKEQEEVIGASKAHALALEGQIKQLEAELKLKTYQEK